MSQPFKLDPVCIFVFIEGSKLIQMDVRTRPATASDEFNLWTSNIETEQLERDGEKNAKFGKEVCEVHDSSKFPYCILPWNIFVFSVQRFFVIVMTASKFMVPVSIWNVHWQSHLEPDSDLNFGNKRIDFISLECHILLLKVCGKPFFYIHQNLETTFV